MTSNYRIVVFIAVLIFGIFFSIPSLTNSDNGKKITLGLDLQGGLHMLLGVHSKEAITANMKSIAASIKFRANKEDILLMKLEASDTEINVVLRSTDDANVLDTFFSEQKGLIVSKNGVQYTVHISTKEKKRIELQAVDQAVETIRNRLDQFGLAEPTVAKQGDDKILVELPGIEPGSEDENRARSLISKTAHLQLLAVDEERAMQVYSLNENQARMHGDLILKGLKPKERYLVKALPILDGGMLTNAQVGFDQNNQPVINFSLNAQGSDIFGDFTEKNTGKRLAVVLDNVVYSDPVIRERIGGGHGQISGNFSVTEANDLAIALRSGALLASVYLMEKRSVGPSLGQDSIDSAMLALIGGFLLVVIFMMAYYGLAGVIANIALVANLFILIAVMALLGATLTLPGMAGIVLTVGMAVDANVIISERIRELLQEGVSIKKSIEQGYANAMRAILDANVTTLIAAVVLYMYGSGPIKGFAITMSIGILASMLTAIIGTHGMYDALLTRIQKSNNTRLWFGVKKGAK